MFVETFKPATMGPAVCSIYSTNPDIEDRSAFMRLPMNLTTDEIRELVLEVLG